MGWRVCHRDWGFEAIVRIARRGQIDARRTGIQTEGSGQRAPRAHHNRGTPNRIAPIKSGDRGKPMPRRAVGCKMCFRHLAGRSAFHSRAKPSLETAGQASRPSRRSHMQADLSPYSQFRLRIYSKIRMNVMLPLLNEKITKRTHFSRFSNRASIVSIRAHSCLES